jgi:hypothetical protein
MQVYDCKDRDVASVIGSENLGKLSFDDLLEQGGASDAKLVEVVVNGLDANRPISAKVFPGGKDSQPYDDFIDVPDWPSRLKSVELALKVKNNFPAEKQALQVGGIVIINEFKRELGIVEDQLTDDSFRGTERLDEEDSRALPVSIPATN